MAAMPSPEYEVVCLCAAWCNTCTEYRPGFEGLAAKFPQASFKWLDTEDDAEEIADLGVEDVENFPTLLIKRGSTTLFYGPQPPSPDILKRLLETLIK
jgi:thioredoxin 1